MWGQSDIGVWECKYCCVTGLGVMLRLTVYSSWAVYHLSALMMIHWGSSLKALEVLKRAWSCAALFPNNTKDPGFPKEEQRRKRNVTFKWDYSWLLQRQLSHPIETKKKNQPHLRSGTFKKGGKIWSNQWVCVCMCVWDDSFLHCS